MFYNKNKPRTNSEIYCKPKHRIKPVSINEYQVRPSDLRFTAVRA